EGLRGRQRWGGRRRGGAEAPASGEGAEPVAVVLDGDGGAAAGWQDGLEGPASARGPRRYGGWAGEVSVYPRVTSHPGRVHGTGAARRHGCPDQPDGQEAR